jgi:CBS domain-containing protein
MRAVGSLLAPAPDEADMITAGQFCNREVVIATRSESVLGAARRMREHHVGSIVVVEKTDGRTRPVGILTDRDIVIGPVASGIRDLDGLPVGEVMSATLVTASEDESLVDALKRMRSFGLRRLPVVDRDGGLQGIIAFDDLVELFSEEMTDLSDLVSRERRRESGDLR